MTTPPTASQTVGPFFHLGFVYLERENLVPEGAVGERIAIKGKVLDGEGNVVPDAVLEVWHTDSTGRYFDENSPCEPGGHRLHGFGRIETNDDGEFRFTTIKPGRVRAPDGSLQAPHIVVTLFSRGLLKPLHSRIYFPDEAGNADDPVLKLVPPGRRSTLIAARSGENGSQHLLHWNIVMQGNGETVFFDC